MILKRRLFNKNNWNMVMNRGIMDLSNMVYNPPRKNKRCSVCGVLYLPCAGPQKRCDKCRLVVKECGQCGKTFQHATRERKDGYLDGNFCSLKCRVDARRKVFISAICPRCGETYLNRPSRIDKFCSRECYWKSMGKMYSRP